tara:strand:+ start:580 stop:711 length:132 start_codon:yes stop_codon:yes gene_type:complete
MEIAGTLYFTNYFKKVFFHLEAHEINQKDKKNQVTWIFLEKKK